MGGMMWAWILVALYAIHRFTRMAPTVQQPPSENRSISVTVYFDAGEVSAIQEFMAHEPDYTELFETLNINGIALDDDEDIA